MGKNILLGGLSFSAEGTEKGETLRDLFKQTPKLLPGLFTHRENHMKLSPLRLPS